MKYIIDRFEGKWAVCEAEDGKMIDIEKSKLPKKRPRRRCDCAGERKVPSG